MTWQEKESIAQKEEKQLQNIDELIHLKKYNLARREIYNLLEKYPNFHSLNKRTVILNHLLGDDYLNVIHLEEAMENSESSKIRSSLFECYYYIHDYEKAFKLLDYFMDAASEEKLKYYRIYELVLMKKLGIPITLLDFEKEKYLASQVVDYSDKLFNNYLKGLVYKQKHNGIYINKKIDLKLLVSQIRIVLINSNRSKVLNYSDIYHFKCPNFATDSAGNAIDYIRVKVIPGTNDILRLYPIQEKDVDILNPLAVEKKKEYTSLRKIKRKSQLEKFYSRYNR